MHSTATLLAVSHCKRLEETLELIPRADWGLRYPLVHNGWVIGLVDLLAVEVWYKAACNEDGCRAVPGRWRLIPIPTSIDDPRHTMGWSHAVLDNV
jgi:hypothetical protein